MINLINQVDHINHKDNTTNFCCLFNPQIIKENKQIYNSQPNLSINKQIKHNSHHKSKGILITKRSYSQFKSNKDLSSERSNKLLSNNQQTTKHTLIFNKQHTHSSAKISSQNKLYKNDVVSLKSKSNNKNHKNIITHNIYNNEQHKIYNNAYNSTYNSSYINKYIDLNNFNNTNNLKLNIIKKVNKDDTAVSNLSKLQISLINTKQQQFISNSSRNQINLIVNHTEPEKYKIKNLNNIISELKDRKVGNYDKQKKNNQFQQKTNDYKV